jgi:hypothetical protein
VKLNKLKPDPSTIKESNYGNKRIFFASGAADLDLIFAVKKKE